MQKSDLVSRMSLLGTSGKHAKNCERDFHILLKTFSKRLGVEINNVPARFYCHASATVRWENVSVHTQMIWRKLCLPKVTKYGTTRCSENILQRKSELTGNTVERHVTGPKVVHALTTR